MKYRYEAINVDLGVWMVKRFYERDGKPMTDESLMSGMGDATEAQVVTEAILRARWA